MTGATPLGGQQPSTVEIITPQREHVCQLPNAEIYPRGTLARCVMCGDAWIAKHSRTDYGRYSGQWWRLGWFGLWRNREALR